MKMQSFQTDLTEIKNKISIDITQNNSLVLCQKDGQLHKHNDCPQIIIIYALKTILKI